MTDQQRPLIATPIDQVEAVIGTPSPLILLKQLDRLDDGCEELLRRAPIAGIGYLDTSDRATSDYVGGAAGFTTIIDNKTISVPLHDKAKIPKVGSGVGMVFLFPGIGEVLRLNGKARSYADGRLTIAVEEAYVHCSRAVTRAGLWNLPAYPARDVTAGTATAATRSDAAALRLLDDVALARVMANSPFLVLSSFGPSGTADTSPRGDAPGFVHRLDGNTLAIPDRKGNQRADTFHNLAHDSRVSFAALVPGTGDIAIISGDGAMTTEPQVLRPMALNDNVPQAALMVRVTSARVVSIRPLAEALLWNEDSRTMADSVPDMNALASRQIALNAGGKSQRTVSMLLKPMNAVPGLMNALTNFGLNRALAKEGYGRRDPYPSVNRTRKVRITSIRRESDDVVSVRLKDVNRRRFDFLPGQYFTVSVNINGRALRRSYSSSQPPGRVLCLSIKRHQHGLVSTYFHQQARRGDVIEVSGPNGDFTPLASASSSDVVLIGAGSGITPLHSTVKTALQQSGSKRTILIYGNRTEHNIVFKKSLHKLAKKHPHRLVVRNFLTQPPPNWTGGVGRIGPATLSSVLTSLAVDPKASYWLCGPAGMMQGARDALLECGVSDWQIHEERFGRAAIPDDASRDPMPVTIKRGTQDLGRVNVSSGTTILEAAFTANVPMKYSCTVGDCGQCAARLLTGNVVMASPNCLSQSQIDDNVILTCIGRPDAPTTIDTAYAMSFSDDKGTGFRTWSGAMPIDAGRIS